MGTEQSVHRNRTVPVYDESMSVRLRNNYHPLHFHDVHGENIKLTKNKTVACRAEGFCNGIVFSDRPVTITEPIYIKFLETSPNWSGALRIGFTMNDPVSMKSKLPRYACPDLTSMRGNWAKAIGEKYAKKDSVLYYYVDQSGDVHYGIGSEEYGIIFGGVNTSGKLWAVLDIYGNTVAVEFLDPCSLNQDYTDDCVSNSASLQTIERAKFKQPVLQTLSFHNIHGKNVTLKKNRFIASKKAGTHTHAYVFTERPIEIGKSVIMVVAQTDHYCEGLLVYGLTSCDPTRINPQELPENAYDLLDRSEYWIVKQKPYPFEVGDIITFKMNNQGQVEVCANDDADPTLFVDYSQPLWIFVNLTHSISELNLKGISANPCDMLCDPMSDLRITDASQSDSGNPSTSGQQSSNECVVCYEEQVDCALYRCGHMCMCYNCALKVWRTSSGAHCPICRESIHDIIKVYK